MNALAWWRQRWLLLVGHLLERLVVGAGGGEGVEGTGVLGIHQDFPVDRRRIEQWQEAPLLLHDCVVYLRLPQRLDVVLDAGRLYRNVV